MPPNNKKWKVIVRHILTFHPVVTASNSKWSINYLTPVSVKIMNGHTKNTSDVHFYGFFPSFSHYELIVGGFKKNEYFIQRKATYMNCIYLGLIWRVYVKGLMQEFSNHYLAKSQLVLNLSNLSCKHWIYMYIRLISQMKFCVKT